MECLHTETPIIVKMVVSNGHTHIRKQCPSCGRVYGNPLSKSLYKVENLPVYENLDPGHKCEVVGCKSKNVELHHFFPKALAEKIDIDPDSWPTAYLCDFHHNLWHAVITPGLDSRSKNLEELLKTKML